MANWKTTRLSMPQTSAGIVGISHDENIAGIEVDPKIFVVVSVVLVLVIKALNVLVAG